ncbi:hypothetical protein BG011_001558, partial [Mortierella polycephala]
MEYKPSTKNVVCSSGPSTLAYPTSESASTSVLSSHHPRFSASSSSRSRRINRSSLKFLTGCLLGFSSLLASVHANINCAQPAAGESYKAGDPIVLDWGSDGSTPTVAQISSLTAKLYCNNSGKLIEEVKITNWATAFTWTVPSVGNATTVGGTEGICAANAFHMEYEGTYKSVLIDRGFGPVRCGTITIAPEPNGVVTPTPTITTTASTSTSTSTTTKATKSSTDASPSPTESSNDNEENGGKVDTYIIVIVAIAAFVILVLVAVGVMFYLRKQRIKRMESAIMPWSSQSNNQFSKMSDEDQRAPSNSGGRSPGVAAAAAAGAGMYGSNKPQPSVPQPSHGQGYYHDDGYGYGNQHQQGYGHDGYNNAAEDEYYNPNYSQGAVYTGHNHQSPHQGYGSNPASTNPPYYNGSRTPYQDPNDPFQQQNGAAKGGYFPPPPPVTSNANEVSGA